MRRPEMEVGVATIESATEIRPFTVEVPEEDLVDLRRRISSGDGVANTMKLVVDNVDALVIPGIGHWLAEQAPDEMVAVLTKFLAPCRDGGGTTEGKN